MGGRLKNSYTASADYTSLQLKIPGKQAAGSHSVEKNFIKIRYILNFKKILPYKISNNLANSTSCSTARVSACRSSCASGASISTPETV